MTKTVKETDLTTALSGHLRAALPGAVVFKHTDPMSPGVPDISVTYGGATVWIEGKVSRKGAKPPSTGLQDLNMRRLASHGWAVYVVWSLGEEKSTYLMHPSDFIAWPPVAKGAPGWNHQYVAKYVKACLPFGKA